MISVCIANYNGIGMIDACIDSVRRQDCAATVEIIVHDDASTDGSVAHIRSCHPGVRLIEGAANAGFCVANNRMAAAAQGEYLLLLNNDATLMPGALEALIDESGRLGRHAVLTLPQYDAETDELLDMGSMLDLFLNPVPNRDPARGEVGTVHGACLWIPKSLWQELGGFPEWFGSVAEDLYLCCRARLAGQDGSLQVRLQLGAKDQFAGNEHAPAVRRRDQGQADDDLKKACKLIAHGVLLPP